MPRRLITLGLGLIAAWVLLQLVSYVREIALGGGALLVMIGLVWHFLTHPERR